MDRLLIIDDQLGVLQMLERRFVKLGYEVFITQNRDEAFEILKNFEIDLVLIDYMMPDLSGFDLFLSFHKEYTMPVIMMTAHSSIQLAIQFMKNGGVDFVEKPLDIGVLHLRIERAIADARYLKKEIAAKKKYNKNSENSIKY